MSRVLLVLKKYVTTNTLSASVWQTLFCCAQVVKYCAHISYSLRNRTTTETLSSAPYYSYYQTGLTYLKHILCCDTELEGTQHSRNRTF